MGKPCVEHHLEDSMTPSAGDGRGQSTVDHIDPRREPSSSITETDFCPIGIVTACGLRRNFVPNGNLGHPTVELTSFCFNQEFCCCCLYQFLSYVVMLLPLLTPSNIIRSACTCQKPSRRPCACDKCGRQFDLVHHISPSSPCRLVTQPKIRIDPETDYMQAYHPTDLTQLQERFRGWQGRPTERDSRSRSPRPSASKA